MSSPRDHWAGINGRKYTTRQALTIESRRKMFADIFDAMLVKPMSVIEFGANVGDNLRAIRQIQGGILTGVEINEALRPELEKAADSAVIGAIQSFNPYRKWDLAFTRGLLIHIPPNELEAAYATLHNCSNRYIVLVEYYNPTPIEIEYQGQMGLLWKRDFAGDMLDKYPDLRLVDYGFVYRRDVHWPQDDVTWFLLERKQ